MGCVTGPSGQMATYLTTPSLRLSALLLPLPTEGLDLLIHCVFLLPFVDLRFERAIWQHDDDVAISAWLLEESLQAVGRKCAVSGSRADPGWIWVWSVSGEHVSRNPQLTDGGQPFHGHTVGVSQSCKSP